MHCVICGHAVMGGINLSDGRAVHKSCLELMQKRNADITTEIDIKNKQLSGLNQELLRENGIIRRLSSIFLGRESNQAEIEKTIYWVKVELGEIEQEYIRNNDILKDIYDYYLEYPPDWEDRKSEKLNLGKYCQNCGSFVRLQVHHDTPLGKGGSNKIENLVVLCDNCHKDAHGVNYFRNAFGEVSDAFDNRISLIREAIQDSCDIEFLYKKPTDDSYFKRTVTPDEIVSVPHRDGVNATLCVRGYCHLREEDRIFALKRMKKLRKI